MTYNNGRISILERLLIMILSLRNVEINLQLQICERKIDFFFSQIGFPTFINYASES